MKLKNNENCWYFPEGIVLTIKMDRNGGKKR